MFVYDEKYEKNTKMIMVNIYLYIMEHVGKNVNGEYIYVDNGECREEYKNINREDINANNGIYREENKNINGEYIYR